MYKGNKKPYRVHFFATTNVWWDNILAVMPHKFILKISSEPTYLAMRTWFKKICTNLIAVETPQYWGRGKGYLCMLQAPAVFHGRSGDFYNPPPNAPPAYPNILPGAITAERERLQPEHKVLYVYWAKYVHIGRIAVNIGAAAFNEWVLAAIEDPDEGLNRVTIRDVFDYVMGNDAKSPKPSSTTTSKNSTNQSMPAKILPFTFKNKNSARRWRKIHMYQSPRPPWSLQAPSTP